MRRTAAALAALGLVSSAACTGSHSQTARAASPSASSAPPAVVSYRSAVDGVLPTGRTRELAGIRLPAGHAVGKLWITDEVLERPVELWRELAGQYASTGLWPLVLDLDADPAHLSVPDTTSPPSVTFEKTLAETWKDQSEGFPQLVAPFEAGFPGLAARPGGPEIADAPEKVLRTYPRGRLALAAVHRPADVPLAVGWGGATNYFDAEVTTAVLRSEEDRLSAILVFLGDDLLVRALLRPPRTRAETRAIAAEQFAFCPDAVTQGFADAQTLDSYASKIAGEEQLYCWWD